MHRPNMWVRKEWDHMSIKFTPFNPKSDNKPKDGLIMKIIQEKRHMGSSKSVASRTPSMPKGSAYFNAVNGTKVRLTNGATDADASRMKKLRNTMVASHHADVTIEEAALFCYFLFEEFDYVFSDNTQSYKDRKCEFDSNRNKLFQQMGVSSYDQMTREQKQVYAQKMVSSGSTFDYYTFRIHVKFGSNDTVKTRTIRSADKVDVNAFLYRVLSRYEDNCIDQTHEAIVTGRTDNVKGRSEQQISSDGTDPV